MFYTLAQEDGVDRLFRILSPRCFPACLSPQQRDTRSLSAFQKRIYGNWAKKLRTYVPTNLPPAESSTNGSVGVLLTGDYLVRRLEEHLLRLPFFKIIVMGIKKKIEPISDLENLVRIILVWCGKQDWILTAHRRSQATLWPDSLRLLQVLFLL